MSTANIVTTRNLEILIFFIWIGYEIYAVNVFGSWAGKFWGYRGDKYENYFLLKFDDF